MTITHNEGDLFVASLAFIDTWGWQSLRRVVTAAKQCHTLSTCLCKELASMEVLSRCVPGLPTLPLPYQGRKSTRRVPTSAGRSRDICGAPDSDKRSALYKPYSPTLIACYRPGLLLRTQFNPLKNEINTSYTLNLKCVFIRNAGRRMLCKEIII
jgi:hypothetical protein